MSRTAVTGYSGIQILLHWLIALLVIFQLVFNEGMAEVWDAFREGGTTNPSDVFMANVHIWVGSAVLLLACWRLFVRLTRGAPPAPVDTAPILRTVASFVHIAIYFLIFAMPISGLIGWFGGVGNLVKLHSIAQNILIGLIILHVLGAAYHAIFLKDQVLQRMLSPED